MAWIRPNTTGGREGHEHNSQEQARREGGACSAGAARWGGSRGVADRPGTAVVPHASSYSPPEAAQHISRFIRANHTRKILHEERSCARREFLRLERIAFAIAEREMMEQNRGQSSGLSSAPGSESCESKAEADAREEAVGDAGVALGLSAVHDREPPSTENDRIGPSNALLRPSGPDEQAVGEQERSAVAGYDPIPPLQTCEGGVTAAATSDPLAGPQPPDSVRSTSNAWSTELLRGDEEPMERRRVELQELDARLAIQQWMQQQQAQTASQAMHFGSLEDVQRKDIELQERLERKGLHAKIRMESMELAESLTERQHSERRWQSRFQVELDNLLMEEVKVRQHLLADEAREWAQLQWDRGDEMRALASQRFRQLYLEEDALNLKLGNALREILSMEDSERALLSTAFAERKKMIQQREIRALIWRCSQCEEEEEEARRELDAEESRVRRRLRATLSAGPEPSDPLSLDCRTCSNPSASLLSQQLLSAAPSASVPGAQPVVANALRTPPADDEHALEGVACDERERALTAHDGRDPTFGVHEFSGPNKTFLSLTVETVQELLRWTEAEERRFIEFDEEIVRGALGYHADEHEHPPSGDSVNQPESTPVAEGDGHAAVSRPDRPPAQLLPHETDGTATSIGYNVLFSSEEAIRACIEVAEAQQRSTLTKYASSAGGTRSAPTLQHDMKERPFDTTPSGSREPRLSTGAEETDARQSQESGAGDAEGAETPGEQVTDSSKAKKRSSKSRREPKQTNRLSQLVVSDTVDDSSGALEIFEEDSLCHELPRISSRHTSIASQSPRTSKTILEGSRRLSLSSRRAPGNGPFQSLIENLPMELRKAVPQLKDSEDLMGVAQRDNPGPGAAHECTSAHDSDISPFVRSPEPCREKPHIPFCSRSERPYTREGVPATANLNSQRTSQSKSNSLSPLVLSTPQCMEDDVCHDPLLGEGHCQDSDDALMNSTSSRPKTARPSNAAASLQAIVAVMEGALRRELGLGMVTTSLKEGEAGSAAGNPTPERESMDYEMTVADFLDAVFAVHVFRAFRASHESGCTGGDSVCPLTLFSEESLSMLTARQGKRPMLSIKRASQQLELPRLCDEKVVERQGDRERVLRMPASTPYGREVWSSCIFRNAVIEQATECIRHASGSGGIAGKIAPQRSSSLSELEWLGARTPSRGSIVSTESPLFMRATLRAMVRTRLGITAMCTILAKSVLRYDAMESGGEGWPPSRRVSASGAVLPGELKHENSYWRRLARSFVALGIRRVAQERKEVNFHLLYSAFNILDVYGNRLVPHSLICSLLFSGGSHADAGDAGDPFAEDREAIDCGTSSLRSPSTMFSGCSPESQYRTGTENLGAPSAILKPPMRSPAASYVRRVKSVDIDTVDVKCSGVPFVVFSKLILEQPFVPPSHLATVIEELGPLLSSTDRRVPAVSTHDAGLGSVVVPCVRGLGDGRDACEVAEDMGAEGSLTDAFLGRLARTKFDVVGARRAVSVLSSVAKSLVAAIDAAFSLSKDLYPVPGASKALPRADERKVLMLASRRGKGTADYFLRNMCYNMDVEQLRRIANFCVLFMLFMSSLEQTKLEELLRRDNAARCLALARNSLQAQYAEDLAAESGVEQPGAMPTTDFLCPSIVAVLAVARSMYTTQVKTRSSADSTLWRASVADVITTFFDYLVSAAPAFSAAAGADVAGAIPPRRCENPPWGHPAANSTTQEFLSPRHGNSALRNSLKYLTMVNLSPDTSEVVRDDAVYLEEVLGAVAPASWLGFDNPLLASLDGLRHALEAASSTASDPTQGAGAGLGAAERMLQMSLPQTPTRRDISVKRGIGTPSHHGDMDQKYMCAINGLLASSWRFLFAAWNASKILSTKPPLAQLPHATFTVLDIAFTTRMKPVPLLSSMRRRPGSPREATADSASTGTSSGGETTTNGQRSALRLHEAERAIVEYFVMMWPSKREEGAMMLRAVPPAGRMTSGGSGTLLHHENVPSVVAGSSPQQATAPRTPGGGVPGGPSPLQSYTNLFLNLPPGTPVSGGAPRTPLTNVGNAIAYNNTHRPSQSKSPPMASRKNSATRSHNKRPEVPELTSFDQHDPESAKAAKKPHATRNVASKAPVLSPPADSPQTEKRRSHDSTRTSGEHPHSRPGATSPNGLGTSLERSGRKLSKGGSSRTSKRSSYSILDLEAWHQGVGPSLAIPVRVGPKPPTSSGGSSRHPLGGEALSNSQHDGSIHQQQALHQSKGRTLNARAAPEQSASSAQQLTDAVHPFGASRDPDGPTRPALQPRPPLHDPRPPKAACQPDTLAEDHSNFYSHAKVPKNSGLGRIISVPTQGHRDERKVSLSIGEITAWTSRTVSPAGGVVVTDPRDCPTNGEDLDAQLRLAGNGSQVRQNVSNGFGEWSAANAEYAASQQLLGSRAGGRAVESDVPLRQLAKHRKPGA